MDERWPLVIRSARSSEREALEDLQRRSSLHWPMFREQLAGQPDAIAVPGEQISSGPVRVAEQSGLIVGFAVLLERCAGACELDGLFVEPDWMGTGIGRGLVNDAKRIARERGATRIDVVANPQAGGVRKPDRAVLVELAARPQTGSEIWLSGHDRR